MTNPTKHPHNPPTNTLTLTRIVPDGSGDLNYQISCWEQEFNRNGRMEGDDYADPDNGIHSHPYTLAKGEYATKHYRTLYLLRAEGYFANNVQESERAWVLRTNAGQWTVQAFREVAEHDGWYRHTVAQILARDGWKNSMVYRALHIPTPKEQEEKVEPWVSQTELNRHRADAVRGYINACFPGSDTISNAIKEQASLYADEVEQGEK